MAQLATEDMDFEDIATEEGVKNIMNRLRDFFLPHLEVSLPRAFEAAVYGKPRQAAETFPEYLARMERAVNRLGKEGVDPPNGVDTFCIGRLL